MKRKGPQRHSNETIQSAITMYEGGAKLSAIARKLEVEKSTVKYWLDNASKFLPESGSNPVVARIGQRATRESWDLIFAALKQIKRKLSEGNIRDLMLVVSELFDLQARMGTLTGKHSVPVNAVEKSEEVRITVQRYLKQRSQGETVKTNLSGEPVEQIQGAESLPESPDIKADKEETNGAT